MTNKALDLPRVALLMVFLGALLPSAAAQEPGLGDTVVLQRADGSRVTGILDELTDDHVVIKLRFGSVKIARADVASLQATEKPATPISTASPDEIAEQVEAILDLLAERETVEASKKIQKLLKLHSGNAFLADGAAQREMLNEIRTAELHEEVVDLESLAAYLELLADLACADCGGPGERRCKTCRGKGRTACVDCRGKGRSKCGECRGKGKLTCPKCGGSARMDCDDCGVNDNVCCSHGLKPKLGLLRRYREGESTQVNNAGRGRSVYVDCPECSNNGKDTCDTCDPGPTGMASGFNECKRCQGERRLECRRCGGTRLAETCTGCNGDKATRCASCGGSGQRPTEPEDER